VEIAAGSRLNTFAHCRFAELGAGGVHLSGGAFTEPPLTRVRDNLITDCEIGPYGRDFLSGCGVLSRHAAGTGVVHCDIHDGFYSGVSLGWTWGYLDSVARDNVVSDCHIHDIGKGVLNDMGGIYTLGAQPGTVLKGNRIHGIAGRTYGGWGFYPDEGTRYLLIEKNVVYDCRQGPLNIHYGREIEVRNNIFAGAENGMIHLGAQEPHKTVFFHSNIVWWKNGLPFNGGRYTEKPYVFRRAVLVPEFTRSDTMDIDYNLYWNPHGRREAVRFRTEPWEAWVKHGFDSHSAFADPLFADPEHGDFTLAPNSPVYALGFEPFDFSRVGPRE